MPFIHIQLGTGRTLEQKQKLLAAVARATHETIGAPLETIRAWVTEVDPAEFTVGGVPLDEVRARRAGESAS